MLANNNGHKNAAIIIPTNNNAHKLLYQLVVTMGS